MKASLKDKREKIVQDRDEVVAQVAVPAGAAPMRENEKACRGRRCGRLSEKNRTTAGRRSAVVPADVPGRRMGRLHIEGMREEVHRFDEYNHTYLLLR